MSKEEWSEKDRKIIRQNTSRTAFEFFGGEAGKNMDYSEATASAKGLAKEIEGYVLSGDF